MTMDNKHRLLPVLLLFLLAAIPVDIYGRESELEKYLMSVRDNAEDIDMTSYVDYFDGQALAPIEGVWRTSGSEGMFAVVADRGGIFYRIIVVDSVDQRVLPGTVMGACTPAGREAHFDAQIFTSVSDKGLGARKRFTISLSESDHLVMEPVTDKLRINLWRLLPYMFRHSVTRVNDRPKNLDGAIRVFPLTNGSSISPRYL